MVFVSGSVQKDLDSKHSLRHSKSSSCSLAYLITSLSMQAISKSTSCDKFFTWTHVSVLTCDSDILSTVH